MLFGLQGWLPWCVGVNVNNWFKCTVVFAGTYYLCRTLQNIKTGTKKFRIQWLSLDKPPNVYKFDYVDKTDIECVLTSVRMDRMARETYKLPSDEQSRVEKLLNRTLKIESGDMVEEELEEEVENEVAEDGKFTTCKPQ